MPAKGKGYHWRVGKEPPPIEAHSLVKHEVIREYLRAYVQILCASPKSEMLRISLVDGFAGGGLYRKSDGQVCFGSPFILLNTVREAEKEVNARRDLENIRTKVEVISQIFLIEKNVRAFRFLQHAIKEHYRDTPRDHIHPINADFLSQLDCVIDAVKKHGRSGRCIFVLDQYGYKEVPLQQIQQIFNQLPHAEIILTFAIDAMVNYVCELNANNQGKILERSGFVNPGEYEEFIQRKLKSDPDNPEWRFFIQSRMIDRFKLYSGAKFITPFFIISRTSNRGYWLLHLSTHAKANDAMKELHWKLHNTFEHYGGAGLHMLAYDPDKDFDLHHQTAMPFMFDSEAEKRSKLELLDDIPMRLAQIGEISFGALATTTANETPATRTMIKKTLITLARAQDLELLTESGGKRRSENPNIIKDEDIIRLKIQRGFSFF